MSEIDKAALNSNPNVSMTSIKHIIEQYGGKLVKSSSDVNKILEFMKGAKNRKEALKQAEIAQNAIGNITGDMELKMEDNSRLFNEIYEYGKKTKRLE